jgi:two-component system sensor histidine kinase DctS
MQKKEKRRSFFRQILKINILVYVPLMAVILAVSLYSVLAQIRSGIVANSKSMADALAQNYMIYDSLVSKRATNSLIGYLDNIIRNNEKIDSVTVIDNNRICVYHYDNSLMGTEVPIVPDGTTEVQSAEITFDRSGGAQQKQMCAFAPVLNAQNQAIGYVIIGVYSATLWHLELSLAAHYLVVIGAAIAATFAASAFIAAKTRTTLLGYEPDSIAARFVQRSEIMNNLEEGVLATDRAEQIIFCNRSAYDLLEKSPLEREKQQAREFFPSWDGAAVLKNGRAKYHVQCTANCKSLLLDYIPIKEKEQVIGTICIIRDRTVMTDMAKDLTGYGFIVDALRANVHNFKNELHVILGMLQLGETEMAIRYIGGFGEVQQENSNVISLIQNKTIAALILGKMNEAKEQDIELTLEEGSNLPGHNAFLSVCQLTVILGNLLENAIDAAKGKENGKIQLYISCGNQLKVHVDDNGCGIAPALQSLVFERGISTKGSEQENHGIGLYTVKQIVDSCQGVISIDSMPEEGTSVSVEIARCRAGHMLQNEDRKES